METPKVNRRKLLIQILLVTGLCVILGYFLVAIGALRTPANSHRVTFRIEASGGFAMITYSGGSESINDATFLSAPWEKSLVIPSNTQVYLTGGNPSQSGTISCNISLDGNTWKSQKAEFPTDHVACAGLVP